MGKWYGVDVLETAAGLRDIGRLKHQEAHGAPNEYTPHGDKSEFVHSEIQNWPGIVS